MQLKMIISIISFFLLEFAKNINDLLKTLTFTLAIVNLVFQSVQILIRFCEVFAGLGERFKLRGLRMRIISVHTFVG